MEKKNLPETHNVKRSTYSGAPFPGHHLVGASALPIKRRSETFFVHLRAVPRLQRGRRREIDQKVRRPAPGGSLVRRPRHVAGITCPGGVGTAGRRLGQGAVTRRSAAASERRSSVTWVSSHLRRSVSRIWPRRRRRAIRYFAKGKSRSKSGCIWGCARWNGSMCPHN